jgi:hypothetical protein
MPDVLRPVLRPVLRHVLGRPLTPIKGVGAYAIELIEDFGDLSEWTINPFGTAGGAIAQDADALRLSTPDTASSYVAATKTFSPGIDLSRGGFLVLRLANGSTNMQGAEVAIYLSSNNFASSKFMYEFASGIVRGADQYVVMDLDEFTASGGESIANPMTHLRVRMDSAAGSGAITFSRLYYIPAGKDRPRVVLSFDDGWDSQYDIAFPYLTSKGMVATAYVVEDYIGQANFMSLAEVQELYTAGWDIANHTKDHVAMTEAAKTAICASQTPVGAGALTIDGTLAVGGEVDLGATPRHIAFVCTGNESAVWIEVTGELYGVAKSEVVIGSNGVSFATDGLFDLVTGVTVSAATAGAISVGTARTEAEALAAIDSCHDYLVTNSMPRAADHFCYPRGLSTPSSDRAIATADVLTARCTRPANMPALFGVPSIINMPGRQKRSVAEMKAYVDLAIATGTTAHIYLHKLHASTDDDLTIPSADFEEVVDYIALKRDAGALDVLTITQWYDVVTSRARVAEEPADFGFMIDELGGRLIDENLTNLLA